MKHIVDRFIGNLRYLREWFIDNIVRNTRTRVSKLVIFEQPINNAIINSYRLAQYKIVNDMLLREFDKNA